MEFTFASLPCHDLYGAVPATTAQLCAAVCHKRVSAADPSLSAWKIVSFEAVVRGVL